MEIRWCKVLFPNYSKFGSRLREKREKVFLLVSVHLAARGAIFAFTLKIVNTLVENSSRYDKPSISSQDQPTVNPRRVGQR